jgi:hypothetical protein
MQFLVYLTILMVSISTVLLEVHWLTSPAPQPKPAVQAANGGAPPRKVEGPTAALSPVYPKPEGTTPVTPASEPQSQPSQSPASSSNTAAVASNAERQKPTAETTGVAARAEYNHQETATTPENRNDASQGTDKIAGNRQGFTATQATTSNNHCDVQACAAAYQSFRASDCTYQPFEGARRVCEKTPVQRTAREQSERTERRQWSRDAAPRDGDRTVGRRVYDDPDESDMNDDDSDRITIYGTRGPRW